MEPILAALIGAATLVAKDTASEAIKDAYRSLKGIIKNKIGSKPETDLILDSFDSKPDVWTEPLRHLLEETGAHSDPEILKAAEQLSELIGPTQIAIGDQNVLVAGDVGTLVQGDYVRPAAQSPMPWRDRPGGPQFRLFPGVNAGRLLCEFQIDGAPPPGGVEARWQGAGTEHDWTEPMRENVPPGASFRKYQLKPVSMSPKPPRDEVTFEVRFNLDDGPHGGQWVWLIEQHEKGHWNIEAQKGSGVFQPRLQDTY